MSIAMRLVPAIFELAQCAYTMANGKGPQRGNTEVMLVDTVGRWRYQTADLFPERAADLRRIVEAGVDSPKSPPRKEGKNDGCDGGNSTSRGKICR